jgi:hypothetical protein
MKSPRPRKSPNQRSAYVKTLAAIDSAKLDVNRLSMTVLVHTRSPPSKHDRPRSQERRSSQCWETPPLLSPPSMERSKSIRFADELEHVRLYNKNDPPNPSLCKFRKCSTTVEKRGRDYFDIVCIRPIKPAIDDGTVDEGAGRLMEEQQGGSLENDFVGFMANVLGDCTRASKRQRMMQHVIRQATVESIDGKDGNEGCK